MTHQDTKVVEQINQCVALLKQVLGNKILGVYLYGSSVHGGLQKYSDLDLFVVLEKSTTENEKKKLINKLLQISGIYMKDSKLPIELTIVVKSEINPWRYPPRFDFQYGEWLREQFETCEVDLSSSQEMPDLALLITQILLANKTLVGVDADKLLVKIPYKDFVTATMAALPNLISELDTDTRNVLLTAARIWSTVMTDTILSKPAAADWAIHRLPENYRPVMARAKAICKGEESENWDDMREFIKPCVDYILSEVEKQFSLFENVDCASKLIKLDDVRNS